MSLCVFCLAAAGTPCFSIRKAVKCLCNRASPERIRKKAASWTADRNAMTRRISPTIFFLSVWLPWAVGLEAARAEDLPPSPAEVRALVARMIANQHRDDAALDEYERTEHRQVRQHDKDTAFIEDKTFRVIPAGTGTAHIQIEERGRPVDSALYRKQLQNVEQALVLVLNPTPRQRQDAEKYAKRTRDRRDVVDAVGNAFLYTWLGRETRNGRTLAKLRLEPNSGFKPTVRNTSLFANVRATAWVDEAAGRVVRVEAEIFRDIYFGGGLLGKVYHGGRFALEQAEVAPGVWLPTLYDYNFAARKLFFGVEVHERTEVSRYHRIGPPREALAAIRRELGSGLARSDP